MSSILSEVRDSYGLMTADYKTPFIDLATASTPEKAEDFHDLALYIYYTNPIVRLAISKLAEYAVTDLEYNAETTAIEDRYRNVFEKVMRIKRLLIVIGLDAFINGNCVVTLNFPVERKFSCPKCEARRAELTQALEEKRKEREDTTLLFPSDDTLMAGTSISGEGPREEIIPDSYSANAISDLTYKRNKFNGTCPTCGSKVVFSAIDEHRINERDLIVRTWPINLIRIKAYPWSGKEDIYWDPPSSLTEAVEEGDMDVINETPMAVLDAIREKKIVKLNNVYHFKLQGPTDVHSEWGKGLLICAFKTVYFLDTLKRASEAVANEHITPFRMLAPVDTDYASAVAMQDRLRSFILEEFKHQREDPNYIGFSPIPVQEIYFGGKGRAFLPSQEVAAATEDMLLGFGLPRGLIAGEATWAGNTISLRIIENFFLTHRDQLQEFLDWSSDIIQSHLNYAQCEVKMREFKMLDDIQHKQMIFQMVAGQMIPSKVLIEMEGLNYEDMQAELKAENIAKAQMQADAMNMIASAQSSHQASLMEDQQAIMVQQMNAQQQDMTDQLVRNIQKMMSQGMTVDQAAQIIMQQQMQQNTLNQMMMLQMQADQAKQLFLMDRMNQAQWSTLRAQRESAIQGMMNMMPNMNPIAQTGNSIYDIAMTLAGWDRDQRDEFLRKQQQSDPVVYEQLVDYMNSMGIPPGQPHPMADNQGGRR